MSFNLLRIHSFIRLTPWLTEVGSCNWLKKFSGLVWVLLLVLSSNESISQSLDYSYTIYDKTDGLPSNTVYDMVNDQDGIMWIGTDAGLCKFDGSHFKVFTTEDGLPSNDIFKLYCDQKNRIWILSMASSAAYILEDRVHNKYNDSILAKINIGMAYNQLYLGKHNDLRIVSSDKTIYDLDSNDRLHIVKLNHESSFSLALPVGDSMFLFSLNSFEVFTNKVIKKVITTKPQRPIDKLSYYNNEFYSTEVLQNFYTKISKAEVEDNTLTIRSNGIRPILHNHKGQLMFIENNGILVYDTSDLRHPIKKLLNEYPLLNYFQDKMLRNWYCSRGNGLITANSESHRVFRINESLNESKFHSVFLTPTEIEIGDNKGHLYILDRNTYNIKKVLDLNKFWKASIRILKVSEYSNGLIISSDCGTYLYNSSTGQIRPLADQGSIKNHYLQKDTLMILNNAGVELYSLKTFKRKRIAFNRIYSYCDYKGQKLLGTEKGLFILEHDTIVPYELNIPFDYRIMDIFIQDSMIVLLTVNDGLFYVKGHSVVRTINVKKGLSTNNCFKMFKYNNEIFIATSNGVNIYNTQTDQIRTIFESDGLAFNTVNDLLIERDTLYAATENGLSIIALKDVVNTQPFPLFSKPVIIGNKNFWNRDTLFQSRTDQSFTVVLNSLSYGVKGKVTYFFRYKDSIFTSTTDPKIPLIFSSPGHYVFEAYALDNNKRKSNLLRLHIEIEPYVWQTWYFILFMILVGITLLVFVAYLVDKNTTKRESLKRLNDQKLYQLELEAWQSKFNPHFLFNSLSSISSLIQTHRGEKAVLFIQNFSFILRRTIQNSSKLLNQIEEEVHYIENYLNLELIKRNDLFTYTITFSSDTIKSYYIPSLLIQPVIENSLKHGIRSNQNGHVFIHFELEEQSIHVTISDNGKIEQKSEDKVSQHRSMGMKLIEDKIKFMEKLLKQKIGFSSNIYDATDEEGAITTFIFPLITKDL